MNAAEITYQIAEGGEIAAAIAVSRYALVMQCQSVHYVKTNYGVIRLTDEERDELSAWLTATLERRLAALKAAGRRMVAREGVVPTSAQEGKQ